MTNPIYVGFSRRKGCDVNGPSLRELALDREGIDGRGQEVLGCHTLLVEQVGDEEMVAKVETGSLGIQRGRVGTELAQDGGVVETPSLADVIRIALALPPPQAPMAQEAEPPHHHDVRDLVGDEVGEGSISRSFGARR